MDKMVSVTEIGSEGEGTHPRDDADDTTCDGNPSGDKGESNDPVEGVDRLLPTQLCGGSCQVGLPLCASQVGTPVAQDAPQEWSSFDRGAAACGTPPAGHAGTPDASNTLGRGGTWMMSCGESHRRARYSKPVRRVRRGCGGNGGNPAPPLYPTYIKRQSLAYSTEGNTGIPHFAGAKCRAREASGPFEPKK